MKNIVALLFLLNGASYAQILENEFLKGKEYIKKSQLDSARNYFTKELNRAKNSIDSSSVYVFLGDINKLTLNFEVAYVNYTNALNYYKEVNDSSGSTFDSYDLWFKTFHATTLSNNDILDVSKEIELYPNPTNNKAFINTQFNGEFSVYNILGEKLISFTTKAGIQREIDLTNLTDGVYIIREQKGAMKKLIVK